MTPRNKLTAERVRALLDCDPEAGTLTWRERPGNPSFNVQWAGKQAGSIDPTTGYLRLMIDGVHAYVHRIIWLHTKGWLPSVDLNHHDGDNTELRDVEFAGRHPGREQCQSPIAGSQDRCPSRFAGTYAFRGEVLHAGRTVH